MYRVQSFTEFI